MDDLKRRMGAAAGFSAEWLDEVGARDRQLESVQLSDRLVERTLDRLARDLPEVRLSWWAALADRLGLRRPGLAVMFGSSLCAVGALLGAGVMHAQQAAAIEHTSQEVAELRSQLNATRAELASRSVVIDPSHLPWTAYTAVLNTAFIDANSWKLMAPQLGNKKTPTENPAVPLEEPGIH